MLHGQFRRAAKTVFEEAPPRAYAAATAYLSETLDWLNLWEHNHPTDFAEEFEAAPQDHLYPHL
jgi:hypothetical protein